MQNSNRETERILNSNIFHEYFMVDIVISVILAKRDTVIFEPEGALFPAKFT